MSAMEMIALGGLALNVLVAVVGLTWGIAKIRDAVRAEIEAYRNRFDGELGELDRSFGKNLLDQRDKIREIELYVRDTYLRRDSFQEVIRAMQGDLRSSFDKIDQRLERMEKKIDTAATTRAED